MSMRNAPQSRSTISPCFECGLPAFHDYCVIPARLGGTKTVPLCPGCLFKVKGDDGLAHAAATRAGIRAYRDRGGKVGAERPECRNLTPGARERAAANSAVARAKLAVQAYAGVTPLVFALRDRGLSLRDIAERLNFDRHLTRSGRPWNHVQVNRVLKLAAAGREVSCHEGRD